MSRSLRAVVERRRVLVARAVAQRAELAAQLAGVQSPLLRWADAGFRIVRAVRARPALLALAAVLLLATRRQRPLLWSRGLFAGWELFRFFRDRRQRVAGDRGSS